jgi:2-hydroxy-3-keto-5-methylthiopentenyl-1-phosphate phosphatase
VAAALPWSVLCDFDATVSLADVTDSLLEKFAQPGWQELEEAWREGRIGSRACMAGQVALLDCSRDQLDAHLAAIDIDPDFKEFVAAVAAAGASLRIVSDGLDHVIRSILSRHGLAGVTVHASRLVQTGPRRWQLEFPWARADCLSASATCKCAWAGPGGQGAVLMIGDGASDFCVAGRADLTFAKDRLLAHCIANDLRHLAVADFGRALAAWSDLSLRGRDVVPALELAATHG